MSKNLKYQLFLIIELSLIEDLGAVTARARETRINIVQPIDISFLY